jgi:DnaK suppressor protein
MLQSACQLAQALRSDDLPLFPAPQVHIAMNTMNGLREDQLASLRTMLEQRRDAIAHHGNQVSAGSYDRAVDEVETSPADKATVRLLNDLAQEAAGHNAAQLGVLKRALAKFDDGSYGECEECGNPIGFSRLQARPEAPLCIACQTRAERR